MKPTLATVFQFCILIVTKIVLEISFAYFLVPLDKDYYLEINLIKYFNGWLWIIAIFIVISLKKKKCASKLLLFLHLYIGIVPLSIVFAFMNQSSIFFNCCCGMYFAVALGMIRENIGNVNLQIEVSPRYYNFACNVIVILSIGAVGLVLGWSVVTNGLPEITALNLNKVYEVREDYFINNKYIGYLYTTISYATIPFLIAYFTYKEKYGLVFVLLFIQFVFFLYSGNKTTLFSLVVIIPIIILGRYQNMDSRIMNLFSAGVIGSVALWIVGNSYMAYSLFVRRTLMAPANLKFIHYEFFLNNPYIGLSGTLLGKVTGENGILYNGIAFDENLTTAIGRIFFDRPQMGANTGFLVEGFSRFGYVGFVIIGITFFVFLRLVDYLQYYTDYRFALITSIYFIFSLNDGYLISSLVFGPGLFIIMVALFIRLKQSGRTKEYVCLEGVKK